MPDGDSKFQFSELFSPGVILLLIGIAGYLVGDTPLRSLRPDTSPFDVPQPPHPPSIRGVHSRLWEDPLAASFLDWKEQRKKFKDDRQLTKSVHDNLNEAHEILGTALANSHRDRKKVLVLPVLVPGGPYVDDVEQRMRTRYAVLSALAVCGYKLSFPQRMSYAVVPVEVDQVPIKRHLSVPLLVPIKMFSRGDDSPGRLRYDYVFVLWINELQLENRPLAVIGQVVEQLFGTVSNRGADPLQWLRKRGEPPRATPEVRIIGPTGSDSLFEIARECREWTAWSGLTLKGETPSRVYRHVTGNGFLAKYKTRLYSPRATISGGMRERAESYYAVLSSDESLPASGLQGITRTIGTDAMLVRALARELELRGKWVAGQSKGIAPIVLVAEQDTLYGRAFPRAFQRALRRSNSSSVELRTVKYLRGIDGKLPGQSRETPREERSRGADSGAPQQDASEHAGEQATGRSQVDYLRRLEAELAATDAELRRNGKRGIQAIGVVGTDVYDKLLVLRALRKRFPDACFFTTDLDAALAQKGEYRTVRNLVVASHFGLKLHPRLQRSVAPFRDSYQTSMYFAALLSLEDPRTVLALKDHGALRDPWGTREGNRGARSESRSRSRLQPLVYEIGRRGPYQLTLTGANDPGQQSELIAVVHPASPRENPWLTFGRFLIIVVIVLAAFFSAAAFLSPVRKLRGTVWKCIFGSWERRKGWSVPVLGFGLGAILLLMAGPVLLISLDHSAPNGEPFSWDDGISLWPATVIRYAVVLLGIGLALLMHGELQKNQGRLSKKYQISTADPAPTFWQALLYPLRIGKPPDGAATGDKSLLRRLLSPWAWRTDDAESQTTVRPAGTTVFEEYLQCSAGKYRRARTLRLIALFCFFGMPLGALTGNPTRPYRGPVSDWSSLIVLIIAVLAMLGVTFLVLDRLQVCRRFLRLLQHARADWDSNEVDELTWRGTARREDVRELFTVRLAAEHTNAVLKLVYYPFLLVLLMILARWPVFDYLNMPLSLLAILLLLLLALLWSAYDLRRGAQQLRDETVSRLRAVLIGTTAGDSSKPRAEQIEQLIAEIQRERRGAYGPWARDPIVGSLALVFGGSGGLLLIQRFLPNLIF